MHKISRFLFNLLLLGYVEDSVTGLSVSIPGGIDWKIYVEVPSRIGFHNPEDSLYQFNKDIPVLHMLGAVHSIDHRTTYTNDDDVQLVCKYLKTYWDCKEGKGIGINRLFKYCRLCLVYTLASVTITSTK